MNIEAYLLTMLEACLYRMTEEALSSVFPGRVSRLVIKSSTSIVVSIMNVGLYDH